MDVNMLNLYQSLLSNGTISSNSLNSISSISGLSGISGIGSLDGLSDDGTSSDSGNINTDFSSVLSSYLNTDSLTSSVSSTKAEDAVEWMGKLSDAMSEMDKNSTSYKTVQELYDYFQNQAYSQGGVSNVISNLSSSENSVSDNNITSTSTSSTLSNSILSDTLQSDYMPSDVPDESEIEDMIDQNIQSGMSNAVV